MKKITSLLMCAILCTGLSAQELFKPEFAGHRGCNQGVENTREAFINGAQRGYQYLETDLKVTADSQYVCWHDDNLDRVTTSGISIANTNLADLQALTLTQTRNGVTYTAQITTIGEYLDICREYGCKAILELKWSTGINTNDCSGIPDFLNYCDQHLSLDSITFLTSMQACLTYIRNRRPNQSLMYLCYNTNFGDNTFNFCNNHRIDVDVSGGAGVNYTTVKRFHDAGLKVGVWTIDTQTNYTTYAGAGCDVVTTNAFIPANMSAVELIIPEEVVLSTLIPNITDYPTQEPDNGVCNSQALTSSHFFALPDDIRNATIQRAILHNSKWYVLANQDDSTPILAILDPLTGTEIRRMDLTGVEGGIAILNDIAFTADGVLLACNKENVSYGAGGNPFKIYRWDSDDAIPQVFIAIDDAAKLGNWSNSLSGVTFCVSGTINNNDNDNDNDSLMIYIPACSATRIADYRIAGIKIKGDTIDHFCYAMDAAYKAANGWKDPQIFNSPNSQLDIILNTESCQPTEYTFNWNGTRIPMENRALADDNFAPQEATALSFMRTNEHIYAVTTGSLNNSTSLIINDITHTLDTVQRVAEYETSLATLTQRAFTGIELLGNDLVTYILTNEGMEIISNHDYSTVINSISNNPISTRIYPNPATDFITIENTQINQIELYTLSGQTLPIDWQSNTQINVSHLNNGFYILQVNSKPYLFEKKNH